MNKKRKRRLIGVLMIVVGVGVTLALALYALRQNVDLYYTPTQMKLADLKPAQLFRLGGMVVKGSVQHVPNTLTIHFALTDFHQNVEVYYTGILPTLFREGQGIVAEGHLNSQDIFMADTVLAKHDSSYRPPNIASAPHAA